VKNARRYAQGTDVSVSKSRGEIEALLIKHGAAQILSGYDQPSRSGFVGFTLAKRQYRIPLLARGDRNRDPDQVERERWRALLLVIKAQLEFVAAGIASAESMFLAHLVLPGGETVGAYVAPRLAAAYESGQMPPLLPQWSGDARR
jgi:hypothetical protein